MLKIKQNNRDKSGLSLTRLCGTQFQLLGRLNQEDT